MSIRRPDLEDLKESIQVFFYSMWSVLYYIGVWVKKNYHRFVHLIWAIGFAIVFYVTMNGIWMWISIVPAMVYVIFWVFWFRRIFDANN